MASGIYEKFKANLMNKAIDLEADVIKVSLMDNVHTFSATDNVWADVSANELPTSGGYTAGGATLASAAVTQGATTKFDGADTAWTSSTFSAYHAVLWDDSITTPTVDDLICSFDFGGVKTVTAGTFTIQWHANGIITLT
jgi:hypothetical protein